MARRKYLVVGNWKMYVDSVARAKELAGKVVRTAARLKRTEVVICPPHPFLGALAPGIARSKLYLGAQDVSSEFEAKRTGETSAYMLRSLGVSHVIVGHSERRALGETNKAVAMKAARTVKAGLSALVCIGESERDMQGRYLAFLERQIKESLAGIPKAKAAQLVVAYEPVWAIGKTSDDAMNARLLHETTLFIKKILVSLYGRHTSTGIKILYGGSVEAPNASALITEGAINGFLVGHASADAKEFSEILKAVDKRAS